MEDVEGNLRSGGELRNRQIAFGAIGVLLAIVLIAYLIVLRKLRLPLLTMMAAAPSATIAQGPTVINVTPVVLRDHVIRLGMNLGNEDYYDSQQILKNLVSENPGFEGQEWQTVLQCGNATPTTCADAANDGSWTEGFLDGGTYEVIGSGVAGAATGQTGSILHSTAASSRVGTTLQFAPTANPPRTNDFIVVRKITQGDPTDGWNKYVNGGASLAPEYKDLSPRTPGSQALRVRASGPGQFAAVSAAFDSTDGHSYVQLRGPYQIRFRAKAIAGAESVGVKLQRSGSATPLFDKSVALSNSWQDYTLDFEAREGPGAVGTVSLGFIVSGTELLLDDVSLEEATSNGTAFRDDVVATLQRLRPGVLRYMDSGQNFGSSLDNMLAPQQARRRSGSSRYSTVTNGVPIGLHDFLVLCEKLGTEPWYTMQIGMSAREAAATMEYLGGPVTTKYGAERAALGHPIPWTQTFPRIHLEYGNEAWNTAQAGATIPDSAVYAGRANLIFQAMRASPWYPSGHFDLVANTQSVYAGRTVELLQTMRAADTIDIAPYIFSNFADDSSIEHIYGPMFAQPQLLDDTVDGDVHQQAHAAATAEHPVRLAVYEVNMGTISGTASQASVNTVVPSLGAGLAVVEHELLMLRDLGVTVQNTFQIGGGNFPFNNTVGTAKNETTPVWGVVVDMGGPINRVRPTFLAQQLVNQAIRSRMLTTSISGDDPTWDQPLSANDKIALRRVHELQSFAFGDSATSTLVVVNLSRTSPHDVRLTGACAPHGHVTVQTLTSAKITDTNELAENVRTVAHEEPDVVLGTSVFTLPPFSLTSFASSNPASGNGCR